LQALLLKWTQAMGAVTCPPFEGGESRLCRLGGRCSRQAQL